MVTARSRCAARRAGRPDPIWVEATVKPLEGGGYVLVDTKPLRPEYGGDGRTPENTKDEPQESTTHPSCGTPRRSLRLWVVRSCTRTAAPPPCVLNMNNAGIIVAVNPHVPRPVVALNTTNAGTIIVKRAHDP